MASYHLSAQLIRRSAGQSAIAAAAYRSGARLSDERDGRVYDFSRRRGVVYSEILVPDGAASFLKDRQALWNHVQSLERREDAQLAREINLALPHELDAVRRREVLLKFVEEAFVDRGMVADVAIHAPVPEKGDDPRNHHAHIMLTLRRATKDGLHRVKTREWNSPELLKQWRALWGLHANGALERAGIKERIDHRTLVVQRHEALRRRNWASAALLDREAQMHIGPKARKIAERGRTPPSAYRERGPARRGAGEARPLRRVLRYPSIDKGSRVAHGATLARRRSLSVFESLRRWQARSARLRLRQKRLSRMEQVLQVDLHRLHEGIDCQWLERKERPHSLRGQVEDAARRLTHVKQRRGQLDVLLAEVDRTLARLLLSQSAARRTPLLLQSNNPRGHKRAGRMRARCPIAPSTFFPRSA